MEDSQSTPFFKNERQKTDDSLAAERDKANKSLNKSEFSTELKTDTKLRGQRRQADQTISESRDLTDIDDENLIDNEQLLHEREQSDRALEIERSQVDLAIDTERELKSELAGKMLEQERKLTDENLASERTSTDSEVQRKAELLSEEITEHTKTKISLTTREEFLAIVSHDLKNPIGVASLCAQLLLDDPAFREYGTEARNSIQLIKRNIDTSLRLIADLLDMERIEGGKLQLSLKKYDLGQIIREVSEGYALAANVKNVELRTISSNFYSEVFCDKDRIVQVLNNLIGNAVKFTPTGGSISLSADINDDEVQFSVCDTGPGIPEERKFQIFERYAQLGVNDRVGLGLGLYISKMLIEAHRGRLWVKSKLGRGSTFSFSLPH